jgi:uncharacterized protein (TIGR03435 family)
MKILIIAALLLLLAVITVAQNQPLAFEVASIKPLGSFPGFAALGSGCDGGFPRVEHNRFTVSTTSFALITWAYGFNKEGGCSFVSLGDFLSGGPDWIRSERFEIQALMPDGFPTYTTSQFLNGEAPQLETMIRNMLADRFKLALHQEMKEASGYALVLGKGGAKLSASKDESDKPGLAMNRRRDQNGQIVNKVIAKNTSMTYLALMLVLEMHRPVVDRTGSTGQFDFEVEFAPFDSGPNDSSGPSIFTALQEQLGLRLESTKVPVEALVIDHAEKPSEN